MLWKQQVGTKYIALYRNTADLDTSLILTALAAYLSQKLPPVLSRHWKPTSHRSCRRCCRGIGCSRPCARRTRQRGRYTSTADSAGSCRSRERSARTDDPRSACCGTDTGRCRRHTSCHVSLAGRSYTLETQIAHAHNVTLKTSTTDFMSW